jgi:hypothetical protein
MIRFRVEGPLEIKPSQGMNGRVIDKDSVETFWEENADLADEVGCYIFGLRSRGGLTPIYVGQSTTGFKHECFHWQKKVYYDEALVMRSGTPIMFFVVKDSGSEATWLTCLNEVEDYLIQLAVQHNPNLANVKRVEWSIPGVFRAGPGHPTASAMALRQILGLAHPVQPAVQKTPDGPPLGPPPNGPPDINGSTECGLPHNQYPHLKALEDGKLHTYRDIVKATGLYSNLPAELRQRHPRSLGSKGLIREVQVNVGGKTLTVFQATADALRRLGVPNGPVPLQDALAEFEGRYTNWRQQYEREESEAERLGLRHNAYLLLRALADGQEHTFADLARATGIFSGLPQDLRARHADSLGRKGLLREDRQAIDGKNVHTFQITAKGKEVLAGALVQSADLSTGGGIDPG